MKSQVASEDLKREAAADGRLEFQALTEALLEWYALHRRDLPWRARKEELPNPYFVWLSEIMLQQTTVATALPYFERFIARWPNVQALASATVQDVRTLWSGLGYYSRAEHIHRTSQKLVEARSWPKSPEEWRSYPGVGPYTAAAISAIAFNFPVIPVDGNVVRVVRRVFSMPVLPRPALLRMVRAQTQTWQENVQASWGDLAQALMDLGATVCVPHQPQCETCPLRRLCAFDPQTELATDSPKPRPLRLSYALCILNDQGELYVEQENAGRLLRGFMKVPLINLTSAPPASLPSVRAIFSHFTWQVWLLRIGGLSGHPPSLAWDAFPLKDVPFATEIQREFPYPLSGEWLPAEQIAERPQSALFRRILETLGVRST